MKRNLDKKSVTILNGSPRKQGNTAVLIHWLKESLAEQKWDVVEYDLYGMNFRGCMHCDRCRVGEVIVHGCVMKDDFEVVLDQLIDADLIVIASPVYCWSVSGCMSAALDRFYAFFKEEGSLIKGKKIVGLFTAGSDEFDGIDLNVEMLKRVSDFGQAIYEGTICATFCSTPEELRARNELKLKIEKFTRALSI